MNRGFLVPQAVILVGFWSLVFLGSSRNIFEAMGNDYALYTVGARMVFSDKPIEVYDPAAVARELRRFSVYYGGEPGPNQVGPLPYPAAIFLFYSPFAYLAPPQGYALWLAASLLVAGFVVWQLLAPVRGRPGRVALAAVVLTFYPLVHGLFFGQPVAFLLLAFYLAYRALLRGEDFAAGLWAGLLFLKVQYPLPLVLVLAYKRRWRALAGMAVTGLLLAASSLAAFGTDGVRAYLDTVRGMSGFRDVAPIVGPTYMINWRGFLAVALPPEASEELGTLLTLALAGLTVACLFVLWRGPWQPEDPRFPVRILGTVLVMLLATYHSHLHGAALLIVPGLDLLVRSCGPRRLQRLVVIGFYAPTAAFLIWKQGSASNLVFFGLMVVTLAVILHWELRGSRAASAS
jgi:hypothetical protein